MSIKDTIIHYFLSKDTRGILNADTLLSYNYMDNHFFTSIEFIEMIADLEEACSITFTDDHLKSEQFSSIGGLIQISEALCMENQCVE